MVRVIVPYGPVKARTGAAQGTQVRRLPTLLLCFRRELDYILKDNDLFKKTLIDHGVRHEFHLNRVDHIVDYWQAQVDAYIQR